MAAGTSEGWEVRGRTVLVTGASRGIGLAVAKALARRGAHLLLVGRDPARTAAAEQEVRSCASGGEVSHRLCDLASQASIRELAAAIHERCPALHVLINNAGGVHRERRLTEDGIEATFAVNHLAPFLLTHLLRDLLVASAPARVINVSSAAHRQGTLDLVDPGFAAGGYGILRAYARSKLANVLFTAELARRLAGSGVTANSVHPGTVATHIWSGAPAWAKPVIFLVYRPFFIDAEQGAEPVARLATDPALAGVSGRYFARHREVAPAPLGRDPALARGLWEVSERLVGALR